MTERAPLRLRVARVVEETEEARSLVFDAPDLAYRPGQFLTLRLPGGVSRCYSLSSSPHLDEPPQVTVKRVPEGYGSNWLCDTVSAGTELEVLPPAGVFSPRSLDGDFLLFAGGSGITPILSIVKSVLAAGTGRIVLVYANRDERSVIFAAVLRELAARHPERLHVVHWLESVQGLPTAAQLRSLSEPFRGFQAFLCGPGPFMEAVLGVLRSLAVREIHVERFVSLTGDQGSAAPADGPVTDLEVDLDGRHHSLRWPAGRRLLDVLLDSGLDAPFSCREGACSACACRITEGEVRLLRNEVLDEQDLAEGYSLACQAVPESPVVKVSYD
ncbi:ferredoxin--NADP reductase [Kutzneria viridogrisea]|uniref:3-ketosteroid 9alpha-monooxygenase subunit B n=1 Tax=Kutzneria viridogrisea TaxID=47990 RepID=A0ABR6BAP8_9PSEU|nr:3-ketosteroid 9alpha-monooxygenase subunit B [Kutzneria viridogrisea]